MWRDRVPPEGVECMGLQDATTTPRYEGASAAIRLELLVVRRAVRPIGDWETVREGKNALSLASLFPVEGHPAYGDR